jgi:hypothetical protein
MKKYIITLATLILFSPLGCLGQNSSETLNEQQLVDLQMQGTKKLVDFYDYLGILSNQAYEKDMRSDAVESAKKVFYANNCFIDGKIAKAYIDSCYNLKDRMKWKVIAVEVKQNMQLKVNVLDNEYYEGVVAFKISSGNDTISTKKAFIVLEKNKRQTASIKKGEWEAYVGDIR